MCKNLILFCLSCKEDIYSFNTSPQVEKEKKKATMDINLRSVAAVTYLGGGLASLRNLFDFPRPLAEHSYQSYLKYPEEKLAHMRLKRKIASVMCKTGWALHYVVIMAKVLAVRTFNRPNNRPYAVTWAIYHHMIMDPPEESVESQYSYCPNDGKTWCK